MLLKVDKIKHMEDKMLLWEKITLLGVIKTIYKGREILLLVIRIKDKGLKIFYKEITTEWMEGLIVLRDFITKDME